MKTVLITQVRIASSRLPSKVLLPLGDTTVLDFHLSRLRKAKKVDEFVVATTFEKGVESVLAIAKKHNFKIYQGSTEDVLSRFYNAAAPLHPDTVVRVTSDCPLIDPVEVDSCLSQFEARGVDYLSNSLRPTFPDGIDCEVFKFSALKRAFEEAKLQSEREHVTPFIWKNSDFSGGKLFKAYSVENQESFGDLRLTIDYADDLQVVSQLVANLGSEASWRQYVAELQRLQLEKSNHKRNEGYAKSISEEQE